MAAKIRQNDEVIVLAGKDKGKRGKVTKVLPNGKVFVEGITSSCFRTSWWFSEKRSSYRCF